MREKSRRHKPVNGQVEGDDSDEDEDMLERYMGWVEESYYGSDEELLAHVNVIPTLNIPFCNLMILSPADPGRER